MKVDVVQVRFLNERREFHIPTGGISLRTGDVIIVETEEGLDCCEVVTAARGCPRRNFEPAPDLTILRKATPNDIEWLATKRETEETAAEVCRSSAAALALKMKLASVKMTFDGAKIIFFFSADRRVDFRALVRELAKRFRTRIEMRQIGVRDKARQLDGIGVCGRSLCCATFLQDFQPVTMKMAKEQNLTLSPSKISGYCGRLMCCLAYENESYRRLKKTFPAPGTRVKTAEGEGQIKSISPLAGYVVVALDSGATVKVRRETLEPAGPVEAEVKGPREGRGKR